MTEQTPLTPEEHGDKAAAQGEFKQAAEWYYRSFRAHMIPEEAKRLCRKLKRVEAGLALEVK